ncbi:hypothetical protein GCG54_00006501 [Colletotrichum gloeosporioides]|uniref:Uncharacterized protein n=1 Tax=Colletotrichum gloeosporioides TaxID=474922 RepID=A0A8H4CRE1_COLGL|nr:uncharacterized protein GCG54_00006501 [Colletotrichum gloeosporioides]KAF3808635.1 hypothetical protein GCG54_00006501 [Colletotrichum gloeosporioides]
MARFNLFNRSKSGFKGGVKSGVRSAPRLSRFARSKEAFIHMFVREHANCALCPREQPADDSVPPAYADLPAYTAVESQKAEVATEFALRTARAKHQFSKDRAQMWQELIVRVAKEIFDDLELLQQSATANDWEAAVEQTGALLTDKPFGEENLIEEVEAIMRYLETMRYGASKE